MNALIKSCLFCFLSLHHLIWYYKRPLRLNGQILSPFYSQKMLMFKRVVENTRESGPGFDSRFWESMCMSLNLLNFGLLVCKMDIMKPHFPMLLWKLNELIVVTESDNIIRYDAKFSFYTDDEDHGRAILINAH